MKSKSVCHQIFQGSWGRIFYCFFPFLEANFLFFLPVLGGEFFVFFKFKLDHRAIHEEGLVFPVQAFDVSSKTLQDVSRRLKKIMF